eukprot:TRINITY_DN5824_c0_g2_i1.p1 TRINITY_DN5824_c0_g2~~TRINITY_DN5824_c0_g2_i1.p1  ORF type:complete len:473 (-),score=108.10 TRINITY_DN5824_c0_g2_i1:172-1590(-)
MRVNRWAALYGCLAVQVVVGTVYGWGNDTVYVTSWLRQWTPDLYYRDTLFTLGSASLGISFGGLPAGIIVDHWPHTMQAMVTISTLIFVASVALTTMVRYQWQLIALYGAVRGIAMGGAHVGPLIVGQKWFPDHLNLVNGVTAAAVGISAFIFNFVTTALMNPKNLDREDEAYGIQGGDGKWYFRPDCEVLDNVVPALLILSGIYFLLGVPGSLLCVNPERRGYIDLDKDKDGSGGHHAPIAGGELVSRFHNFTVREALRSWHLYYLCALLMFTTLPGHVVFAVYKTYARGMDDRFLTLVGSLGALGNALGRLIWGWLADYLGGPTKGYGEKTTILIIMGLQTALLATFGLEFVLDNKPCFLIWTFMVKLCYGGCFAIFPSLSCKTFGIGNFGTIYGMIVFAWGAAGLTGDALVNGVEKYLSAIAFFLLFAGVSLFAMLLGLFQRYPQENDPETLRFARLSMKPAASDKMAV